ncbi:MAG: fructosamine kinase family protein, partial [Bacteroidota bacterium]
MIDSQYESLFLDILNDNVSPKAKLISSRPVSGGDINQAARMETSTGVWFAKWNQADVFPGMFEAEARGLQLLKQAGVLYVPEVKGYGEKQNVSMLVLEFVEQGREKKNFWQHFGAGLAALHKHTNDMFGLDHDNYIGSLPQINKRTDNWEEFFTVYRLEQQIRLVRDKSLMDSATSRQFEKLFTRLGEFFPREKPSLLHGDLWSGNFMTNSRGEACIIDPAVYYGHRLMDIGMSKLFGGFAPEFYQAYHSAFPLEDNWQQAVEIANLYPLLVHVNLF